MVDDLDYEDEFLSAAQLVQEKLLSRVPENKIRPRLAPTARLAELLGDPQKSYRVIHVTGTNGKTSTVRFIDRILRELGLRVGRFTSPHLVSLNERISIDGEPVSNERLVSIWSEIEPIVEFVDAELKAAGDDPLTFFELLAVLGFAIFADAPVDVLVLEVGMGGEWDATNIADGDVSVFTPIGMDHADRLGETIAEIATTKSGIIKAGSIVVSASQPQAAKAVLDAVAAERAEKIFHYGSDFEVESSVGLGFGQELALRNIAGSYVELKFPILGLHQAQNLALAVAAVEAFIGGGEQRLMDDVVRAATADMSSPGRLQIISPEPLIIFDAAHNPAGAEILVEALNSVLPGRAVIGVVSVLAEKDARGILGAFASRFDSIILTQSSSARAIPCEELELLAQDYFDFDQIEVEPKPALALRRASELAEQIPGAMVIATGSITLIGDLMSYVQLDEEEDV